MNGPVAQLVRAPPCHGGGREFESLLGRLLVTFSEQAINNYIWDHSSAGRASALQAEGHRFEPYWSHFATRDRCKFQMVQSQNVTRAPRDAHSSNELAQKLECRSGGTGRRTGLKILRD